jgi:hypothetical protein
VRTVTLPDSLSGHEREVILRYADPAMKDLQEVARKPGITCNTAEPERHNAFPKLCSSTTEELVHLLKDHGWK